MSDSDSLFLFRLFDEGFALLLRLLAPAIGTNAELDWSAFMVKDGMESEEEDEDEDEDEDDEDEEDEDEEDDDDDEQDEDVDVGVIELDLAAVSLVKDLLTFGW